MNVNLKERIRRLVGAILADAGSVVHVGATVREIYDALTEDKKPKFQSFLRLLFRYLETLEKIERWKDVHEKYTAVLTRIGTYQKKVSRLRIANELPPSPKCAAELLDDWRDISADIQGRVECIIETRAATTQDSVVFEEIRDFQEPIRVLFSVDETIRSAIAANTTPDAIPEALHEFDKAAKRLLELANECMIEYLDCIKGDMRELKGSIAPIVQ